MTARKPRNIAPRDLRRVRASNQKCPHGDILERLRCYNPPDRTVDEQRQIAQDIHDAADEIERLRTALRSLGGCSAVAYDGLRCQLRYGHGRNHETRSGSSCVWPDKERDPKRSEDNERQIWASLLKGYGWQPYREASYLDD